MARSSVSDGLLDPFRHDAWANRALLIICRDLTDDQLETTTSGTYGGIRETLQHTIRAEAWYAFLLSGETPGWWEDRRRSASLQVLEGWADDVAAGWERLLSAPIDPERLIEYEDEDGAIESKAGVILTQVLNHGNVHREQVCSILTSMGVEPPEVDAWAYGLATGRHTERPA